MQALIPASGAVGMEAAKCAMFYASRNDWRPDTRRELVEIAYGLYQEANAVLSLEAKENIHDAR